MQDEIRVEIVLASNQPARGRMCTEESRIGASKTLTSGPAAMLQSIGASAGRGINKRDATQGPQDNSFRLTSYLSAGKRVTKLVHRDENE